jgi:hypothetical protein
LHRNQIHPPPHHTTPHHTTPHYTTAWSGNIKLYYSDTDSIFIEGNIDSSFIGSKIGQLKLEYKFKEVVFIAPKVYGGVLEDGSAPRSTIHPLCPCHSTNPRERCGWWIGIKGKSGVVWCGQRQEIIKIKGLKIK